LDLPKLMTREPPPCMFDIRNQKSPRMRSIGTMIPIRLLHHGVVGTVELKPFGRFALVTAATTSEPCGAM